MRAVIRVFFKGIRLVVGPMLLAYEALASRRPKLDQPQQEALNDKTKGLTLYQFKTCPFCVKVRVRATRLGIQLNKRDAQHDSQAREELLAGGGEVKVPCLRIEGEKGEKQWMYESDAIVSYLEQLATS
ncbi:MAG: glutathione S-transferase N-terminal domain-containing protein [Chromatiales bacterium]|nr:glutathione S-transferase N-terminal domain-containing protein [Chromatiales bacterium]